MGIGTLRRYYEASEAGAASEASEAGAASEASEAGAASEAADQLAQAPKRAAKAVDGVGMGVDATKGKKTPQKAGATPGNGGLE